MRGRWYVVCSPTNVSKKSARWESWYETGGRPFSLPTLQRQVQLVPEERLESAAGDEEVQVRAVGVVPPVAVVDENLEALPGGQAQVGLHLREADDLQHGVPVGPR
jgi:hypothetical protein